MSRRELTESILALPEAERLELARSIVESLTHVEESTPEVARGVMRLEELVLGKVRPLSETEYRASLE
jgi:hypothetical protein